MDAMARDRNVDLAEPHPPFPLALPRSRPTATPPTAHDPTVRAVECGTSSQIVGNRGAGAEATRATSSASIGATCLSRLPTPARRVRAGQAGV